MPKCLLMLVHNIIIINGGSSQILKLHYMVNTCMVQWFDMVMFEGTMLCYLLFDSAVRIIMYNHGSKLTKQHVPANKLLHKFKKLANIVLDQYLSRKKTKLATCDTFLVNFKTSRSFLFILKECSFNLWRQFLLI